jgi:hypothetical protein
MAWILLNGISKNSRIFELMNMCESGLLSSEL